MSNATMVKPVTAAAYEALMLDMPLSPAATVDFGVTSTNHYAFLQRAVRGGVTMEELDAVLGDGPAITALVREGQFGPLMAYSPTFKTVWDV